MTRLELQRPIVFFDLEATGTDPRTDRIVEIAAVKLWPDGRREEKHRRFHPGVPIPPEATAVHGITDDDVADAPPFARVAGGDQGIAAFFAGCDLGGFNVLNYDIPLLLAEFQRANVPFDLSDVAVVDAYRIFTEREPRDLAAALRFYCDRAHDGAHEAAADVHAAMDVLDAQIDRYGDLGSSPGALDVRPQDAVDLEGKLLVQDGQVVVSFGKKHIGKTLKQVAREDPGYIDWMLDKGVAPGAERVLRDTLEAAMKERAAHARP